MLLIILPCTMQHRKHKQQGFPFSVFSHRCCGRLLNGPPGVHGLIGHPASSIAVHLQEGNFRLLRIQTHTQPFVGERSELGQCQRLLVVGIGSGKGLLEIVDNPPSRGELLRGTACHQNVHDTHRCQTCSQDHIWNRHAQYNKDSSRHNVKYSSTPTELSVLEEKRASRWISMRKCVE
jgi:hypothetical protein